jgi:hypothetical protein
MALGQIGISIRDIDLMSLRDLMNAIQGFYDLERKRTEAMRDITFGAARYNASNTAMDNNKKIANQKFPWEESFSKGKTEPHSYDKMKPLFEMISSN